MQLELNKKYQTRNSGVVVITNIDYSYTMPFFGIIKDENDKVIIPAGYNSSGMIYNYKESDFDIIKEIL